MALRLEGARIERVDRPIPGLYALSLVGEGRGVWLIASGPPRARPAWSLVAERPRGEPADGHVRGLRERLEGARISRPFVARSSLGFEATRGEHRWCLVADGSGVRCEPWRDDDAPQGDPVSEEDCVAALQRGDELLAEQRSLLLENARSEAISLLRSARERLRRRADAIERDLASVEAAEARSSFASLFVPAAGSARPGQRTLLATDWSSGEAKEVSFSLAPDRPARAQLEAIFARAKRLRSSVPTTRKRQDDALLGVLQIEEAIDALSAAADADAVRASLQRLAGELPGDIRLLPPSMQQGRHASEARPYRRYEGAGGQAILVGRDAASNDELTLRVARPRDLWVHARGRPGAHVIVPAWSVGASELLIDAATLAAHFSEAREEDTVEIQYTPRRHVHKRRGSAPGELVVAQEKVIALRRDPERLARLLATVDREASTI